ncbi:MAG TPA: MAPEG family protein [Steroidobacteraceae bacterium]|nr:MAPEG family protein [Steroidobacteraceae bacterium]
MTRDWIFVPVIVQVLMTLLIYVRLIKVKIRELRAGNVNRDRLALHEDAWPESVLQINNNIRSQFELPVLFYMMTAILWALDAAHGLAMAAASVFVLSRIAHALIHLGSNYVPNRRRTFTVGWWVLMFMALLVLWELVRRAAGL